MNGCFLPMQTSPPPLRRRTNSWRHWSESRPRPPSGHAPSNGKLVGIHQSLFREWSGRFFNVLVRLLTGLKIHDTQCGLKLFRREATRRAFELQTSRRFGFDPELLFLIERTAGRVVEVPVRWDNSSATKVRFLRDSSQMFLDLIRIRWNQFRGRYDPREKK